MYFEVLRNPKNMHTNVETNSKETLNLFQSARATVRQIQPVRSTPAASSLHRVVALCGDDEAADEDEDEDDEKD